MPLYTPNNPLVYTWATKPAATIMAGTTIYISDVGEDGSLWYSTGSIWKPTAPIILHNKYYGHVYPSMAAANAATYSQSGTTVTVTCVGHNIPTGLHNGKSVYLIPGVPTTGAQLAAGLYTNFGYVDANTFTCTSTVSQTGAGPINTNLAATVVTGLTIPILGGLIGLNGWLDVYSLQQCNASAGTKRLAISYSDFVFKNFSPSSTIVAMQGYHRLQNVNSLSKQVCLSTITPSYTGYVVGAPARASIDSSLDQNITAVCTLNTPLDYMSLDHLSITLNR